MAADTTNETLDVRSGTVAEIGPAITWNVEYEGNGFYSLHPNGQKDIYLNLWGEFVDEQSEETMWQRSYASCGGVTWTCDGLVLCVDDYGNVNTDYPEFLDVEQMAWRMVDTATYVTREVQSISVEDFFVAKQKTAQIVVVPSSSNALWTFYEDFSYTIQNNTATSASSTSNSISNTGIFTANNFGVETITIVHKPTQVSTTAKVRIVDEYIINREISYNFDREEVASYIITYHEDYNDNYFDFSILFDFLGGDCTNFVSQCLHRAGIDFFNPPSSEAESGQKQQDPTSWYHIKDYCGLLNADGVSYTWSGAENFRLFWKDRCYEYVVYGSPDQFEADLEYWTNILKTGDVIQLMKNGTTANHSMIVQSVADDTIYIAQHSKNRIDHDIKDTLASSDITDTTCIVVMRIVND